MPITNHWTRRRFLAESAAAAALSTGPPFAFAQAERPAQSAATSPEEITGQVSGLMEGHTRRPLRYRPTDGGFTIRNGTEFFNRPLYGPNNAFRVDAGDLPELSLYLPGHGGNLRLGIAHGDEAKWLFQAAEVIAEYRNGRMFYEIRDPLMQSGVLYLELLTLGEGSGLQLRAMASNMPADVKLAWAFGGVSGRKGRRGGDIGCEVEPVSLFFQVRPEECKGNTYSIEATTAKLKSTAANLQLDFPANSKLHQADGQLWNTPLAKLLLAPNTTSDQPMLIGSVTVSATPHHILIRRQMDEKPLPAVDLETAFTARSRQLDAIASRIILQTPDEYINTLGGALGIAGDAIWDDTQRCVMHGAVAWRNALAGWRGPYVLDTVGWHDRLREHARHWIAKQNTSPVTTATPATGAPDPGSHLSRAENLLHSRGDISHNHYDMNMVFFDALLRHLQWTGDKDFAAEIWPALEMHLEWERRLFRRTFTANGKTLPLYEAYACIWASDNLQYNGGGAAHSTAYNYYANLRAAQVAKWLGKDDTLYQHESEQILAGMRELLWLPQQGTFGESKDLLGPQTVYSSPALWSVYHTIDSEVATPREAWQMAAERLAALKRIPIHGDAIPQGGYILSCSDWLPYTWSLNLLLLGENMHMALALWQAGMAEEAFSIFKGNLIDTMFQGLCPGNFHMTSALDAHRQEAQRDFGDPIGATSRALIEGLFGLNPDLIHNTITIRPGFPSTWDKASLHHLDITLIWKREADHETFEATPHFAKPVALTLQLRAPRTSQPTIKINGTPATGHFDPESIATPTFIITAPTAPTWTIEIDWHGPNPEAPPANRRYNLGDKISLPSTITLADIEDPQHALQSGRTTLPGTHTIFLRTHSGDAQWWTPITFEVAPTPKPALTTKLASNSTLEPLTLTFQHQINDIFHRSYDAPRSNLCSLAIPQQGIGAWAAFDTNPDIDDSGLRAANGLLQTPLGVTFRTPSQTTAPNCLFLSHWQQDKPTLQLPLTGRAKSLFLLMAGTTFPQCSRMTHATIRVRYANGKQSLLELRNPETWWPIEQDYLLDDYLFVNPAPIPPRVDLRTGRTRLLDPITFKGKGKPVPGGAANILELPLDPTQPLASLQIEVELYGIIVALLAATLVR